MNPRALTDAQLLQQHRIAIKSGISSRVDGELRNRGLLASTLAQARPDPTESHMVQLAATKIRAAAHDAYSAALQMAQNQGKSPEVAHEVAAMNVLVSRLRDCEPALNIDGDILKMMVIEAAPFKEFSPQIGHIGIVEYAVWREHPSLANEALISHLVHKMKVTLKPELLNGLDSAPFPWTRFLRD